MYFSKSSEYALKAMTVLALTPKGIYVDVSHINLVEDMSHTYLNKVLQKLVSKGWVKSRKGRKGGFALNADPGELHLEEVVQVFDGKDCIERCPLGMSHCLDAKPCVMHRHIKPIKSAMVAFYQMTTIQDLAVETEKVRAEDLAYFLEKVQDLAVLPKVSPYTKI